jgi:AAA15 family ATPase/GTPase
MLLQFTVGNFHSIKEEITLNMSATTSLKEYSDINIINTDRHSLLKSAVIYGANASGKSQLFNAFAFYKAFILFSATTSPDTDTDNTINIQPFRLNIAQSKKPSLFEASFIIDNIKYRYGFELTQKEVVTEWLFRTEKVKETMLFVREKNNVEMSKEFTSEGENIITRTRKNALFLSVVVQFNGKIASHVCQWFIKHTGVVSGLSDTRIKGYTAKKLKNKSYRNKIIDFVTNADLGIKDIHLEEYEVSEKNISEDMPNELKNILKQSIGETRFNLYSVRDIHNEKGNIVGQVEFDMDEDDSEGTKKIFSLAGPIIDSLTNGKTIFIDELDARLHPILTKYIVSKFNSKRNKLAQLIFITHDTNLLSSCNFRRDQIWFAEKDRNGATDLYSLAEYKTETGKIRNDASYEKDYLKGRYGAIPYLGESSEFFLNFPHATNKAKS